MPRVNRKPYQTDYKFDNAEEHYRDLMYAEIADHEENWTDEDEAALEEYEEQKRIKLAERSEY